MVSHSLGRSFVVALALSTSLAAPVALAVAQQVSVSISPPSANTYTPGPLSVTIQWCAVGATLDPSQKWIRFNGQNVDGAFGWSAGSQGGCDDYAVSNGIVTLGPGPNTFDASAPAYYEPPPPPPPCPPTCDSRPAPPWSSSADVTDHADAPPASTAVAEANTEWVWGSASAQWATLAPIVSLAPYSSGILAGGFNVGFSHSTPAYFSLGQARSITLAYNSSTVRPTPVIFLDASNAPGSSPTAYSIQLLRGAAALNLLNGANVVYYTPSTGTPVRLAVALDAQTNALGTGWHDVTVAVTAHMASGPQTTAVPTRLLVVDQTASPFGKGVDIGLQRVHDMDGSGSYSVIVTEGDGSATFFRSNGECPTCGFISPAGEASTLSKVSDGSLGSIYRRRYPDGSIVDFTSNGLIRRAAGRFGDTTRFIWTDTLLTQIQDPMGKTVTLGYTGGKLTSVTDPAGRVTTYSFNGSGQLHRVTDPDNIATNLTYNAEHLLTSVTDRGGAVTSFTYDALRRVDTTSAPTIQIYTGANVRPRTIITSPQRIVWQPGSAGTSAGSAKLAVRPDTLFARTVGPNGAVVKTAFDRFGSLTKVIGPYGETTTITRDTLGRALVTTEPNGHVTRLSYNGYSLTQSKDSTTGRTITYQYGANATLTRVSGDVTQQEFVYHNGTNGPSGALDSVFGANRTIIQSVHRPDAFGRDTLVSDGGNGKTRVTYDSMWGNVREHVGPRGSVTRYYYDAAGRVDSAWVPSSGVFRYQYDPLNRKTQLTSPLGYVTRYVYGPTTMTRLIDPKGQAYKFAHNALGFLVARHDLGDSTKADSLKYDEAGNVRTIRTRRGDVIDMAYDLLGRLVSRSGPDFPVDSFKYDPAGRWVVAWNSNQRDSTALDQAGRLAATRQAMLGGVAYQLTYTHDVRNRLTNRTAPTGGNIARYVYGSNGGGLDTLCAASACVAFKGGGYQVADSMIYNPGLSGSWKRLRFHDSTNAVRRDSFNVVGLDTLYGGRWWYDSIGRMQYEDASALGTRKWRYYEYDSQGRLVDACDRPEGTLNCSNEYGGLSGHPNWGGGPKPYAYDSAGNRVDPSANATIASGNRVVAFRGNTLAYDANGSIISKTGNGAAYTYTWDAFGRLKEVRNGGVLIASYKYDALGRRVAGTAPDGTAERYVYDRDHVILDVTASHSTKTEYGYSPGVDRLFAVRRVQAPSWTGIVLTDPVVGTVRGIANLSGGTLRKEYQLTPWGQCAADTGAVTRHRMSGREYDQATKLYYMRARYYDPELGRFLSEDPTGPAGGLNLYSYAGNDPVNFVDPTGTQCWAQYERVVTEYYDGNGNLVAVDYGPWEYVGTYCDDGSGGGGGWVPGGGGGGPGGAPPPLPQPQPCPPVPQAPEGASVANNIQETQMRRGLTQDAGVWWVNQVRPGGAWDYKLQTPDHKLYDAFGNFNFGATGAALGFSPQVLLRAAGAASQLSEQGPLSALWRQLTGQPYGEAPHDVDQIRAGIEYYQRGCHFQRTS